MRLIYSHLVQKISSKIKGSSAHTRARYDTLYNEIMTARRHGLFRYSHHDVCRQTPSFIEISTEAGILVCMMSVVDSVPSIILLSMYTMAFIEVLGIVWSTVG
jgi:hypothetical protein